MLEELKRFLVFMRPAFSRRATYGWFVVVFVGFILRSDTYGVSSIEPEQNYLHPIYI